MIDNKLKNAVSATVAELIRSGAHKATLYLSDKMIVRATYQKVGGVVKKSGNTHVVLTIGKPNFRERAFIATCKKAKQGFPLRKPVLKYVSKMK